MIHPPGPAGVPSKTQRPSNIQHSQEVFLSLIPLKNIREYNEVLHLECVLFRQHKARALNTFQYCSGSTHSRRVMS